MSLTKKLSTLAVSGALALGGASARADLYDDFSSGTLNPEKWEVRQDVEGQPLMDEYGIREENGNFVFHTKNNGTEDKRVYLFPTTDFKTGSSWDYDVNVVSRDINNWWGNLIIITGDTYIRAGIVGYSTPEPLHQLGTTHVNLTFFSDNLRFERTAPSGEVFIDNVPLQKPDGVYQMYVGSYSDNDVAHLDYDNFYAIPEPSTLVLLACAGALAVGRKR